MLEMDITALADSANVSLEEAITLNMDAASGDASAKAALRLARIARRSEGGVRKLSETMSISLEEARYLDLRALAGDAIAIDAIRLASANRKEISTSSVSRD